MRFASLIAILALAGAASAQGTSGSPVSNLFGGTPRPIVFTPIDSSKALAPQANIGKALRTPSSPLNSSFNINRFIPNISMPSFPPKTPQLSVLPQAQNPFQPHPIKGGVNMTNISPNKK